MADDPRLFRRTFGVLAFLVGLNIVAVDAAMPAMRDMAVDLGTDLGRAQATLGTFLIGTAIGQLMWGTLGDRFGRRPMLLLGLGTYVVTAFAITAAPAIESVAILRLLQGIGSASAFVLSRAIVRDLFDVQGSARMFATLFQIIGVFPILSPIIGGELTDHLGWRAVYVFIGGLGVASLAVIALAFRESLAEKDLDALRVDRIAASFGELFGDPTFRAYLVLGIGMHIGILAIVAGMPVAAIGYLKLSPGTYGYLYAAVMLAYLVAAMIGGPLIRRFGSSTMLNLGVATTVGAVLLTLAVWLADAVNVVTLVLVNAVYMFGYAWLNPPMVAGALANFHHMAGRATSLMGFVHQATGALTAFAIGLVTDDSPRPHALAMFVTGTIIVLAYFVLVRPLAKPARGAA